MSIAILPVNLNLRAADADAQANDIMDMATCLSNKLTCVWASAIEACERTPAVVIIGDHALVCSVAEAIAKHFDLISYTVCDAGSYPSFTMFRGGEEWAIVRSVRSSAPFKRGDYVYLPSEGCYMQFEYADCSLDY